ncbi:MAG: MGMT family protein [Ardenticatenales bacterium]|nr:MGMT family protein [Ardenticatenales bacterium]
MMQEEKPETIPFFKQAIEMVKCIPAGEVTTYGQISLLLSGTVRGARAVGYALAALSEEEGKVVPWWRVVNVRGRISNSNSHHGATRQRALLEDEGIEFGPDECIDLARYGWDGPEGHF